MKAVSHHQWGADKKFLTMMYESSVLSNINFGVELYGTAAETDLKALEIIQNDCLRIITGCRRTSPFNSLEVETNIPPLDIQRTEMVLKLKTE